MKFRSCSRRGHTYRFFSLQTLLDSSLVLITNMLRSFTMIQTYIHFSCWVFAFSFVELFLFFLWKLDLRMFCCQMFASILSVDLKVSLPSICYHFWDSSSVSRHLTAMLALGWRIRLTKHLLKNYLKNNAYYKVPYSQ